MWWGCRWQSERLNAENDKLNWPLESTTQEQHFCTLLQNLFVDKQIFDIQTPQKHILWISWYWHILRLSYQIVVRILPTDWIADLSQLYVPWQRAEPNRERCNQDFLGRVARGETLPPAAQDLLQHPPTVHQMKDNFVNFFLHISLLFFIDIKGLGVCGLVLSWFKPSITEKPKIWPFYWDDRPKISKNGVFQKIWISYI